MPARLTSVRGADENRAVPAANPHERPRVVFFAEIPTPYILPTLEELSRRVDLTALFGASEGSRGMEWDLAPPAFRHKVVGGLVLHRRHRRGTDVYVDPRILVAMARARPHVIVTPAFSLPTAFAAFHGALTGSRLLIYSDGTRLTERDIGAAQLRARRVLIPRASGCVGLSAESARRFEDLGCEPSRLFVAPHATALEPLWAVAASRHAGRSHALRVLFVGRLLPRKGADCIVRAIALARRTEPGITLDVVGTGPEESRLRELASSVAPGAVRFLGFVDQPGLPELYRAADVFAFPSRRDQFGIVALEAAASGLPLVASPHAGATTDLVVDGSTGYVVEPTDTASMAERLVRLARDPQARVRMGAAARARTMGHTPAVAAGRWAEAVDFARSEAGKRGTRITLRRRAQRALDAPGAAGRQLPHG